MLNIEDMRRITDEAIAVGKACNNFITTVEVQRIREATVENKGYDPLVTINGGPNRGTYIAIELFAVFDVWKARSKRIPTHWQIYVIINTHEQLKIGTTTDVSRRLAQLQTSNPDTLQLVYSAPGGLDTEKHILDSLSLPKLNGEWFSYDGYVLTEIISIINNIVNESM
jgi:hypothetical protein